MSFQGKIAELACLKMLKRPVWQEHGIRGGTSQFHSSSHDPKHIIVTLPRKLAITGKQILQKILKDNKESSGFKILCSYDTEIKENEHRLGSCIYYCICKALKGWKTGN